MSVKAQTPRNENVVLKKQSSQLTSRNVESSAPQPHPGAVIQSAQRDPQSLTQQEVLYLQRTMGNRAVGRLLTQAPRNAGPADSRPVAQSKSAESVFGLPVQRQAGLGEAENRTGMPRQLKAGLEALSGMDLSGIRVHTNSSKPTQLNALAYTQGQDIHVGPGQAKHLSHEGWHAVQQMQGRVKPTTQVKGVSINDDAGLEREADVMGAKAMQKMHVSQNSGSAEVLDAFSRSTSYTQPSIQRVCPECAEKLYRQPEAAEEEKGKRVEEETDKGKGATVQREEEPSSARRKGFAPSAGPRFIENRIMQLKGSGQPMPGASRSFMERRSGADFGDVRIHHDVVSDQISRSLKAQEFPVSQDVLFSRGVYNPASPSGKRLLAHELTHTLQHSGRAHKMPRPAVQRKIGDGHDLTSALISGNAVLEAVFDNERNLKKGNSGKAVELVQQALVNRGYDLPRFGVDKQFGNETDAAVRAFQTDTGATVDGVVGPQTIDFLDSLVQGKPVVAPPAPVIGNALPAANVNVQPGAPPVNGGPLGARTYGLTDTETVTINFDAVRSGPNWVPVVNGLLGNYSLQYRILPTQTEVTGPIGNTTALNFCPQVTELNALGYGGAIALWYMRSAVLAHERVHANRLRPALVASAAAIEASVETLRVPHSPAMNAAAAAAAIRALPAFTAAVANARTVWDAAYVGLISAVPDHAAGGPTDTAEHTIVDPMVRQICRHARAQGWGACSPPC